MARARRFRLALVGSCIAGALALASYAEAGISCVPFARAISAVKLTGDAWTWWASAAGVYRRSQTPSPGAVLVMKRTERLRRGHLAVVAGVLNSREILLDHANWTPGEIARRERAIDVSPGNDWSQVRVWHDGSKAYGVNVYPAYGFVHPTPARDAPAVKPARSRAIAVITPAFKPPPPKARSAQVQAPRRPGGRA